MNVRSVSKLSAAVMTLAILSYCGKKSHDAAAPGPAPGPKSAVPPGNAPTGDVAPSPPDAAPTGTVPANTATTYMQPSCQTADEINTHVTNVDLKAEAFCFHKVEHPAACLKAGQAISADMQLKQDLAVAFLNVSKNFADAQTSCASLGAGWQAPLSTNQFATPQAAGNSNSLAAVGSYFMGTTSHYFWSSSTVSYVTDDAWDVNLGGGYTGTDLKFTSSNVVCVRP